MTLRSAIWKDITKFKDTYGTMKGKCKYCGILYRCDSRQNGTNHLRYHAKRCKKKPSCEDLK